MENYRIKNLEQSLGQYNYEGDVFEVYVAEFWLDLATAALFLGLDRDVNILCSELASIVSRTKKE